MHLDAVADLTNSTYLFKICHFQSPGSRTEPIQTAASKHHRSIRTSQRFDKTSDATCPTTGKITSVQDSRPCGFPPARSGSCLLSRTRMLRTPDERDHMSSLGQAWVDFGSVDQHQWQVQAFWTCCRGTYLRGTCCLVLQTLISATLRMAGPLLTSVLGQ